MNGVAALAALFDALPPPPPSPPDLSCRDTSRSPGKCRAARLSNCTVPHTRAVCAKSCGLCSALVVPVQVATLIDGRLPIPQAADKVFVEVGSSDRNTLDLELLPNHAGAFLVSCEPLVDKYSRAISRRAPQEQVFDLHEPLGQHHSRGIILPIAIAPRPASATRFDSGSDSGGAQVAPLSGGAQTLKVGGSAGCSSLMHVHLGRQRRRRSTSVKAANDTRVPAAFGPWCDHIAEQRSVRYLAAKLTLTQARNPNPNPDTNSNLNQTLTLAPALTLTPALALTLTLTLSLTLTLTLTRCGASRSSRCCVGSTGQSTSSRSTHREWTSRSCAAGAHACQPCAASPWRCAQLGRPLGLGLGVGVRV